MMLHEKTGVVVRHRDGYPVVKWDDPTKCCEHPACRDNRPEVEHELIQRQSFAVGTRVRAWWERGFTYGGMVAEAIK